MKKNSGMTYVELIVVLGIFSTMLSIAMFNHSKFQDKVAIKNLANDIALKLVEAQKSSINGKLTTTPFALKPSYGVYFNLNSPGDDRSFIYFADLDNQKDFNDPGGFCASISGECLNKITLNRANTISAIEYYYSSGSPTALTNLTVTFTRPSSDATISSTTPPTGTISYVQITVISPSGPSALIKLYPSGRVQIN